MCLNLVGKRRFLRHARNWKFLIPYYKNYEAFLEKGIRLNRGEKSQNVVRKKGFHKTIKISVYGCGRVQISV